MVWRGGFLENYANKKIDSVSMRCACTGIATHLCFLNQTACHTIAITARYSTKASASLLGTPRKARLAGACVLQGLLPLRTQIAESQSLVIWHRQSQIANTPAERAVFSEKRHLRTSTGSPPPKEMEDKSPVRMIFFAFFQENHMDQRGRKKLKKCHPAGAGTKIYFPSFGLGNCSSKP